MKRSQALIFGALLIVAALAVSAAYYPHLPPKIPTHWDLSGNPNGYSSKFWGVLHMPRSCCSCGYSYSFSP